jgi:uncharacterized membrane protein
MSGAGGTEATAGSKGRAALPLPQIVVGLLVLAYVILLGTLSLRRHQNLHTNALDLGYTDQAVWNTLQGRPFRFSTYLDAAFALEIPIAEFREPDMLLGYHVEPILAAFAPLYLLHDGPEVLLWLQTMALALAAVPIYHIARHRLAPQEPERGSGFTVQVRRWLPVGFVLLYLLSPSIQAANLSDFHAVALSPVFLLSAFYFLETDRPWGFVAFGFLAMMCKEEVGLLVAMMGLWAALVRRRWALGLGTFVVAAGWSLFSFMVIMPHFSGLRTSAFLVRYGQFGDSPVGIARNLVQEPRPFLDWLRRSDVLRYPRDLWLSSGGLAVLYPLALVMALPSLLINTFSSYGWMRSGGGHYSATIVPFLIVAAIYGVDWLARQIARAGARRRPGAEDYAQRLYAGAGLLLVSVGLVISLVHHYHNGVLPFSKRYTLKPISEHARRASPFIEQVNDLPPGVPVSVGSSLYPQVAHREKVYLFPTISDAQYVLLDVTGPASPVGSGDVYIIVREMLDYAQFGVAGSDHGYLLLERGLEEYLLSPEFYEAFEAGEPGDGVPEETVPVGADFGGLLRLEGFDWQVRPVVRPELVVEITTYWRALAPLDEEYRLVFFFWDEDRNLVRVQPEQRAVHWYPTWLWEPEQLVRVTLPSLPVGHLAYAGVAVLRPGVENRDVAGRLAPEPALGGQPLQLWEENTIVELVKP